MATPLIIGIASFVHFVVMTVLLRRFYATLLVLCALSASPLLAQSGTTPDRIVSPVRTDLPGRTVWAFATTGTGTNVTTFAATDKGLYRSNGGAWTLTSLDKQSVYAVKSRRVGNVTTLLVGTDKGVLRSTDGGNTWVSPEVTTGTVSTSNIVALKKVFDIEIVQPGNGNGNSNGNAGVWFAATDKGVYRSSNDGRSWSLVNIDRTADNNEVRGITVDGNTIIVNLWKEGLWRSTNNGNSWTKLTITGETALCRAVHAQQGTNATVWLAGSVSGNIWRSVNNGTSWTRVYQGASAARSIAASSLNQAGIDAFTGTGRTIFASTPGGIAYSRSYGQTWRHTRTTTPQAVSLALWGNSLHVGLEKQTSALAGKYSGSQLTNGDDSYGIFCTATQLDYNPYIEGVESCGGGGGTGGNGGIIPPTPNITSIAPNPSPKSATPVSITISGANLLSQFVQVRIYPDAELGTWYFLQITSVTPTQIVATVPATFANAVGSYDIQVVHGSEIQIMEETPVSSLVEWTVTAPPPTLADITPATALAGTNLTLTANGNNFGTIGELLLDGTVPLELTSYTTRNTTQVAATFPTPPAQATPYNVSVRVGAQTTGTKPLTVYNPPITLNTPTTSQTPAIAGQPFTVNLTGSGFLAGVTQISVNGTPVSGASFGPGTISFPYTGAGNTYTITVQNTLTASGNSVGTGNFTILTPPPAPTVSSLTQNGSPLPWVAIGSGAQTITVNGSGFQATTEVRLNGSSSGITVQSWTANALTVTVPATSFQTGLQTLNVTAFTPPLSGVGGGVSATSVPLHVVMATPTLTLNPITVPAGSAGQEISFGGTGIVAGQTLLRWTSGTSSQDIIVQANGGSSWKSFLSNSFFQYPTAASIRLYNPAWQTFGGGLSNAVDATVSNTTPILDSINPRSYAWLGVETQIPVYVYGAGFTPSTVFRFSNGASSVDLRPTPINFAATRVLLDVPFAAVGLTPPGILTVRAVNPALRVGEADLVSVRTDTLRVVNPAPVLFAQTLQHPITQLPSGGITLNGSSFLNGVSASVDGVAADVVRNSANQITVTLNAAVQARIQALGAGTHHIIVRNIAPSAGDASLPLVVTNPAIPTVTVTPNPYQLTAPPSAQVVTLTVLNSGAPPYIATNASVSFKGQNISVLSRPAQDRITASIPASLLDAAGSFPITVTNPPVQGVGGGSQSAAWLLNNPRPVVTSMTSNPTSALAGTDVVLTLDGSAFVPAAAVVWRGNTYTPTSNTGNRIVVTIPASALDSAGSFAVIVRNPSGGGDAVNQPLLTVLAPRPRLTTLGQQTLTIGANNGQPLVLNMGGSGFVRGSRFVWNVLGGQTNLSTIYTNSNNLSVSIPANLSTQAGIYRVAVVNDPFNGQGGGVSDTLTFTVTNPQATLNGVTPELLPRFANSADLTFTGSSFVTGARLVVTGLNNVTDTLTTHVQSATQLTATLPASLLDSAATLMLRVLNPAPTDGISNQVNANVVNPRPRLTSLSQMSTLTGLPSLTLTASGSQFMDGAVGYASTNGANNVAMQTVVNNTGSLTLTVPTSALAVAGTVLITVQNPLPRVQPDVSDTLQLTVNNPLPVLDSALAIGALVIGQSNMLVSTQATTVTLFGDSFILASAVKENGASISGTPRSESTLSSNRLSQTQMTATVPATLTAEAGTVRLTVENPTPGGGRSQSVNVAVVHPVPTAQRITPSVVTMSQNDVNIVITGDRFVNTAEILVNGQTVTVTLRTPTRLTATIPATLLATRGAYAVTVRNPMTNQPMNDGGTSDPLTLTVNTPQPLITSINLNGSPNQVPLDTIDVPLTVNGSRFHDSAMVRIIPPTGGSGVVIPTQTITSTQITALIPASVLTVGGVYSVVVENLAPTDAPSLPVTFAVVNPVPQMDSISTNGATPKVVVGMTTPQTITVFGQKFTPTSVVRWRGQNLVTTFVNRNTLTAVLPSALQTRGAVGSVTVFTPTDGVVLNGTPVGGGIGSAPGLAGVLTVTHGVPALTTTTPATLVRDAWSASALPSLTLNGNVIASTASVRVQSTGSMAPLDTTLTPTSVNANGLSLVVTVPRSVVVTAGTFALTITNPPAFPSAGYANDGGTSASVNLTVQNPTPALGSLVPASLAAASPNTLLTVNGSNLTPETQVIVNGTLAPRTIVSATQFTTTLPSALFTLSGYVRVQALNPTPSVSGAPAGDSSNALSLEVFNPVPVLTTVAPVFAPIGGRTAADSVTITLVGTNFVRNAQARIAATAAGSPTTDLPTTFVSTTMLTVTLLPATFTAQAYNITVLNPTPRGGVSVARRFTVTNPLPVLTALLPNSTTASGRPWTLAVLGQFFTATSQIRYNGVLQSLANTRFAPMTNPLMTDDHDTLFVKLPAVPVGDTTFPVVVYNPPTGGVGGGVSDTLRLAIGLPAPTITSISPATTTATLGDKHRAWTLTINGTLFDAGAEVLVSGVAVPTYFVSTTRLRAVLPDEVQAQQARRSIQVRNTPVLTSNIVNQTIQNPAPVLSTIVPQTITAGRDTTITLTGDRFAPDASVRLTFGATTTILTPIQRDSVVGLTLTIPGSLTHTKGVYTLRVSNPALAPTMVPPDTLLLGGGLSATQTLTVDAGKPHSVEYLGVDTLLNTGERMPFITLRFRDNVGNLVDNDPVTLNYINLDSTAIYGYFPITRLSLGNYRADTLRFPTAGRYVMNVDTTYSGALQTIGQNHFTVLTRSAVRVELAGLLPNITAGESQTFTASYFDTQNNPTDVGIRPVVVTATIGGATYRDTLTMTRRVTGVYDAGTVRYPTTGTFTVTPIGIVAANITGDRIFTVTQTTLASVQVSGLDTLLNAGERMPRMTLLFRDVLGNLADPPSVVVNYATTDATVTGAFTVTQLSLGTYRTDTLSLFQAGDYRLSVDTTYTGALAVSGNTNFTVLSRTPVRVELTALQTTLQAGDTLPVFSVKFFDTQNNPTDIGIRPVVVTATVNVGTIGAIAYRDTLLLTRLQTGLYETTAKTYPGAALYTVTPLGISALNITGERTFTVTPRTAANVLFTGVSPALTSGQAQARFRATLRDAYNNLTDNVQYDSTTIVQPTQVWFALSTDATLDDSTRAVNAGAFTIQRTSLGVFLADAAPAFTQAGHYALGVQGISVTSGTAAFVVRPNVDYRIVFENVPDTLVAGDSLRNIVVRYFDRNDNPTDNALGRVLYTRTGGSSTASLALTRLETGVYAVHSTQATLAGTYNVSVSGISSLFMEGNRRFVLRPAVPTVVEFTISTTHMTTRGSNVTLTLKYTDAFGNPADWLSTVSAVNEELASTATFTLARTVAGTYKTTQLITQPGNYLLTMENPPPEAEIIGTNNFGCSPGRPVRVRFTNIPTTLTAGEPLTGAWMTFFDVRGRTTNNAADILTLSSRGAETIEPIPFAQRDPIKEQHSGIFDIEPIVFTALGTDTLRVDSDVDYRLPTTGNNRFTVTPAQAVVADIQTAPSNATVPAGALLNLQVRYRDAFGNATTSPAPLTISTWGTVIQSQPSRTTINGSPVYTANIRINTTGTYLLTLPNIAVQGTTAIIIQNGTAQSVEFLNLPSFAGAGEQTPFRVVYRDAFGNLMNSIGQNVLFTRTGTPSSSGSIALTQSGVGVNAGTAQFQMPGTYTLSTTGFASVIGNRIITIYGVPNPTLMTLSPDNVVIGTTVTITLTGTNFLRASRVWYAGVPLTPDAVTYLSDTQLQATVQLPTEPGYSTFWVECPSATSTSNTILLAVNNPIPILLSINPSVIIISGGTTFAAKNDGSTLSNYTPAQRGLSSNEPVSPGGDAIPLEIGLYVAQPNPFSNATTLRYGLPEEMQITIDILDMTGKQQVGLVHGTQKAGVHTLAWSPTSIASGTYLVRLTGTTKTGVTATRILTIQYIR